MQLDDLPEAAQRAVMEATGGKEALLEVRESRLSGPGGRSFTVVALLADKMISMNLGVLEGGAFSENITAFPLDRILEVDATEHGGTVHIDGPDRRYRMTVSGEIAQALLHADWRSANGDGARE